MKCGHCKTTDVSVDHVRACSTGRTIQSAVLTQEVPSPVKPKTPTFLADFPIEGVFYSADDGADGCPVDYYKVVQSPSTGNWYAKKWDGGQWLYCGRRPLYFITTDDKVTAEQAARFGAVTGSCIFCMRTLTDERSITVGYGPICADHNGLPWGEV